MHIRSTSHITLLPSHCVSARDDEAPTSPPLFPFFLSLSRNTPVNRQQCWISKGRGANAPGWSWLSQFVDMMDVFVASAPALLLTAGYQADTGRHVFLKGWKRDQWVTRCYDPQDQTSTGTFRIWTTARCIYVHVISCTLHASRTVTNIVKQTLHVPEKFKRRVHLNSIFSLLAVSPWRHTAMQAGLSPQIFRGHRAWTLPALYSRSLQKWKVEGLRSLHLKNVLYIALHWDVILFGWKILLLHSPHVAASVSNPTKD